MLKICLKLPNKQFKELPFEEEIFMFLEDLGHSREIKECGHKNIWCIILPDGIDKSKPSKILYPTKSTMSFASVRAETSFKTKASVKKKQTGSDKTNTPPTTKGKRLKTSAKAAKPAKKKQTAKTSKAKGLTVLSEAALIEAEQMELATKRILTQTHSSHASGLDTNEGKLVLLPGFPMFFFLTEHCIDDEQISWKSSEEDDDDEVGKNDDDDDDDDDANNQDDDGQEDDGQEYDGQDDDNQDDDNEQTDSDNDGDDFVHPKFSTHDEEDIKEEGLDLRVHTPSHYESTDDEDSDEEIQSVDVEEEEIDEEDTNEEEEVDELYRDVNVNLEG
ncbi:hypothetical protein Tco_1197607 [Tanacetum coccineum]